MKKLSRIFYKKVKGRYRRRKPKVYVSGPYSSRYTRKTTGLSAVTVGGPDIIPDSYSCKLKYTEILNLSPGLYYYQYQFSGNGIFDPNVTSTGTQPTGRDQLAALYQKYVVTGSRMKLLFTNTVSSASVIVSSIPTTSAIAIAANDINMNLRNPYSKNKVAGTSGGSNRITVSNYMTTKKIFGEKSIAEDDYEADVGAQPTNQWYWTWNAATGDLGTSITGNMIVEITYYVKFFKRITLSNS